MLKTALAVAAIVAALAGTASADDGIAGTAFGGTCNGTVDSGCTYCSYHNGTTGEPVSFCANGTSGFRWANCSVWADAVCQVTVVSFTLCTNLTCS